MAKRFRYRHISSDVENNVPESLLDGEIAINRFAGKEKLFVKNTDDEIIPFIPEHDVEGMVASYSARVDELQTEVDSCNDRLDEIEKETGLYYKKIYLTFIPKESEATFGFEPANDNAISYSLDNGETWITHNDEFSVTVHSGETIIWKGEMSSDKEGIGRFFEGYTDSETGDVEYGEFEVEGNIMSLLYGDDFKDKDVLEDDFVFSNLFAEIPSLVSAKNLALPATALTENCYADMFMDCTSLEEAPKLPATELAPGCYSEMFYNCEMLTSVPALPAKYLTDFCYCSMFEGCTSLEKAPELPAIDLAEGCYDTMFGECLSLETAPALPATELALGCYQNMFSNCTSLISAPKLRATVLAPYCYSYMFGGCESLTTAPALPATTLANNCYDGMFNGCESLTTAPALPATTLAERCYSGMFANCTGLISAPELPATTLTVDCYDTMFFECTSLETTPELPATELASGCYYNMFYGCTSLTESPVLPATTLVEHCYQQMFYNCENLNTVTCYAMDISADNCTTAWLGNVAAVGIFYKAGSTEWEIGPSGIPEGWEISNSYDKQYLTFVAREDSIILFIPENASMSEVSYSLDGGETWIPQDLQIPEDAYQLLIHPGEKIMFKSNSLTPDPNSYVGIGEFIYAYGWTNPDTGDEINSEFDVEGNVMSMIYGDNFIGQTTLNSACTFINLFNSSEEVSVEYYGGLKSAENLVLPATTLAADCYVDMFQGCSGLTTAPSILPATTLADSCYCEMFIGCGSLTSAPALPATTLAEYCYAQMFYGCDSLTTAPELPATTLVEGCYRQMFYNCTSLEVAPELPATTVEENSYDEMFCGCSSLSSITCLATDISIVGCTNNWVDGVAANGTFTKSAEMYDWEIDSVNGVPNGWTVVDYELPYEEQYFTLVAEQDNVSFVFNNNENEEQPLSSNNNRNIKTRDANNVLYYSINGSEWEEVDPGIDLPTINIGYKVRFKGNLVPEEEIGIGSFASKYNEPGPTPPHMVSPDNETRLGAPTRNGEQPGLFSVEGNIMSLIYGDDFVRQTTLSSAYTFISLFDSCTGLISAENLILPATTLAQECYERMFLDCTYLTSVPTLPATTLAQECYDSMFYGCSSLTTAPELPATNLAMGCYSGMFYGCSSLTTAPELPATTLVESCYAQMFGGCEDLNVVKCFATDISASDSTNGWLDGVASAGTFYKADGVNWSTGTDGIPQGWVAKLDYSKYYLTFIPQEDTRFFLLPGEEPEPQPNDGGLAYVNPLRNVKLGETKGGETRDVESGDVYYSLDSGTTWVKQNLDGEPILVQANHSIMWRGELHEGDYGIGKFAAYTDSPEPDTRSPYGFEVQGNVMSLIYGSDFIGKTELNPDERHLTFSMLFSGCTGLTSAENLILPATTLVEGCYWSMFDGCTSLTTAPELPATNLVNYCYIQMFAGCTSLTTAPELPANYLANGCYIAMFSGCSSLNYVKSYAIAPIYVQPGPMMVNPDNDTRLGEPTRNGEGTISYECVENWLDGVASAGTFVKVEGIDWDEGASGIPTGWTVQEFKPYSEMYLTFLPKSNDIFIDFQFANQNDVIYFSIDGYPWEEYRNGNRIDGLYVGDVVRFKGNLKSIEGIGQFTSNGNFEVEGNIMSLLYGDDFKDKKALKGTSTFIWLFNFCTGMTSAENLILPAKTLTEYCYAQMFYGCTSLTSAPELPATTLTNGCYQSMFYGCTSLTSSPELPATNLAMGCYNGMFTECTSLTSAPALPATTLAIGCYQNMFYGCTALSSITCYAVDMTAQDCTNNWVNNVAYNGTFTKSSSAKDDNAWYWGQSGVPSDWAVYNENGTEASSEVKTEQPI